MKALVRKLAAVKAQFVDVGGERVVPKKPAADGKPAGRKRAAALKHVKTRVLIRGNVMSTGPHGVAIKDGVVPGTAWPAVSEAMLQLRRAKKLSGHADFILIKHFDPRATAISSATTAPPTTTSPLYFRLLHASIANALDMGCRELSLGRTALEPRARLGAAQRPMSLLLRHRMAPLEHVLSPILGAIPHDAAPDRHPFA